MEKVAQLDAGLRKEREDVRVMWLARRGVCREGSVMLICALIILNFSYTVCHINLFLVAGKPHFSSFKGNKRCKSLRHPEMLHTGGSRLEHPEQRHNIVFWAVYH